MQTFKKSTLRHPEIKYSRSKEILSPSTSKLQDLTRYNSSKFNVYCYKNSPNRESTPKRPPMATKSSQGFFSPRMTKQELFLMTYTKSFENIPFETKKKFVDAGTRSQIRITTTLPSMTEHRSRKIPFVMNDFHIRETNPGFARNDYGGFFTH